MISLTDVRFCWSQDHPDVLDIPAFDVAPGERVFLRGPSGSGKTTLLNLLGGITVPQAGTVKVGDAEISALSPSRRDRYRVDQIGFVFQLFNLVPFLGLIDNVTLPCRFSRKRRDGTGPAGPEGEARRLLAAMRLDPDALAERPVSQLSVGQQQRVAAARALIGRPGLVIADEPTSSIDSEARRAFLDLLFAEIGRAGATLLLVSHETGLEDLFDRTVSLADINRAKSEA